jgi:hypothetical protein
MALATATDTIEKNSDKAILTNYGHFLSLTLPEMEVDIVQNSSWSCAHGVERWRSDCGCTTGSSPGWNQKWRGPLREALNMLKTGLDELFETEGAKLFKSPWEVRNEYIAIILDRNQKNISSFFGNHFLPGLSRPNETLALKLLEMQRMSMQMFTSCGWFFADLSGIETVQIMKYAEKAIELAREISSLALDGEFIDTLKKAKSNIAEFGSGADMFLKYVRVMRLNPMRIAAHAVITRSLSQNGPPPEKVYSFKVDISETATETYLDSMLFIGVLDLTSSITLESKKLTFCLLHLGAHDYNCFVHPFFEIDEFLAAKKNIIETFGRHSMPELIHSIERHFGQNYFSLKALFDEERAKITEHLLLERINLHTMTFEQLFNQDRKLMDFLVEINAPIPREFKMVARYLLAKRLNSLFSDSATETDHKAMASIFGDAKKWGIEIKPKNLEKNISAYLERQIEDFCANMNGQTAIRVAEAMEYGLEAGLEIAPWKMQNMLYSKYLDFLELAIAGRVAASDLKDFKKLFSVFDFSLLRLEAKEQKR